MQSVAVGGGRARCDGKSSLSSQLSEPGEVGSIGASEPCPSGGRATAAHPSLSLAGSSPRACRLAGSRSVH